MAGGVILRHRDGDAALARLLGALGPFSSGREAGGVLERELTRYATTGYRQDRATGRWPPGTKGLLRDYLDTGAPTSSDWIRRHPTVRNAEWGT